MKMPICYKTIPLFIFFLCSLIFHLDSFAACEPDLNDYLSYPPFVSSRVPPNILLVMDNSGSMNEYAYHEVKGKRCSNTLAWTGYDPSKEYYGLFNSNKCYGYDNTRHYFYVDGDTVDDPTTAIFERSTGSDPNVRKFSGNWLNWFTMRRIDVAKKVLTGGKIAPNTTDVVLEGMPTDDRDIRRIYNDYTTATDPNSPSILTGVHAKNVYYTPFHQGFYSYMTYNVDRGDYSLGGPPGNFVPFFTVVPAIFNSVGDLTGASCASVPDYGDYLPDPANRSPARTAADIGFCVGELTHPRKGYIVAVKVEPEELPVQGIIQKMIGRVRFGYMQFNYGQGPGEGKTRNYIARKWDIDDDGNTDIRWRYADGGRVRNYVGDLSVTTDPRGDPVPRIINNINQQNIQMMTPLEEVLWEAVKYFKQESPQFRPENSPDTPPNNSVNFEVNNTWDPYYFNNQSEFVPCAKSFIIFLSDGEGNNNSGCPSATWPAGANTNIMNGETGGLLEDIAFNMHTRDLRDDTLMGEPADIIDQTITLYSVFCFDDSTNARCQMMKAARAGGFVDLNGDGNTGGAAHSTNPDAFVGDPEWDKDGNNVPDTYFEAQNGAEMEEKIMAAIADILSRTASGTAASVISNARGGEGAIYQAVFFTESVAEPLTAKTVKWYGNVHTLFVDDYGNMHEDTNHDFTLDVDNDLIVQFDGITGKANRYDYTPLTKTLTFVDEIELSQINYVWDVLSWLSDPAMDVTGQRVYDQNSPKRFIFTDYIDTSSSVDKANVNHSAQMPFTVDFVDDTANNNYFFLNPDLTYDHDNNGATPETGLTEPEMISEAQKIILYTRGEEGLLETGTNRPYRDRTLDTTGDGSDDTVFRIGDIVHSTPTVISSPSENYDLIYKDESYRKFRKQYLTRRIVVYAGGNDGMLHAFNGGFYDMENHKFTRQPTILDQATNSFAPAIWNTTGAEWIKDPSAIYNGATSSWSESTTDTSYKFDLGAELWAYVPNALLPHLRWLKDPLSDNVHVSYVDLKPRVFDAKMFTPDKNHPEGWGTVLLGGMRLGGAPIGVDTNNDGTCNLEFASSYFAIDVTNPEIEPELLWTFTDPGLGFTTCYPTPIRMGTKWFIVVGSGPDNFQAVKDIAAPVYGGSNKQGRVYVLNAKTGAVEKEFSMADGLDDKSFMTDPIAVDLDLAVTQTALQTTWAGEVIYIPSDGELGNTDGKIFRIVTNQDENPSNWVLTTFFNPNSLPGDSQHITSSISVGIDDDNRFWVYFGTGRYWGILDKQSPYFNLQNSFYGIKEPVNAAGALNWATVTPKSFSLMNVSDIKVIDSDTITFSTPAVSDQEDPGSDIGFEDIELMIADDPANPVDRHYDGWYIDFSTPGERSLGQAAVLGDIVSFTTYLPDNDVCASEGESYFYGLYYKTGTAYHKGVLKTEDNNNTGIDPTTGVVKKKVEIGKGYSTTPNVHTGRKKGSKAFIQTSTGTIIGVDEANPGITKSSKISWRNLFN
ncbi:MAG: hypothetical protein GY737_11585 [Desulfobacteraceae bacterium]|nr:hypothetical protein [Desulfobacteraceae bacterium]